MTRLITKKDGSVVEVSPLSSLLQTPDKMSMIDLLDPSLFIEPQFNPTTFTEELSANWAELAVPGLSHHRLQYVNTSNDEFVFSLHYDGTSKSPEELDQYHADRRFLQAHCYSHTGADTIASGAPPRILFVWPGFISLSAVIRHLRFTYQRFNAQLLPVTWDVDITLQEIRDARLTFEEVIAQGTVRSGSAPVGQGI